MAADEQIPGRRVAVFGGGPGGLTAAHELAERGFDVTVYERHDVLGGKTRSYSVPGTGTGGRKDLPAELGPHAMFGSYQNVGETLLRIPVGDGRSVADNFHHEKPLKEGIAWGGAQLSAGAFSAAAGAGGETGSRAGLMAAMVGFFGDSILHKLTPTDAGILLPKILALATSGPKRQWGQLEHTSLTDFDGADRLSPAGMDVLVYWMQVNTEPPARMNARVAGSGSLLHFFGHFFGQQLGPGMRGPVGLANGPLNEIWFDPWREHLEKLSTAFHTGTALTGLTFADGRITGATVRDAHGADTKIVADHYILALPPDKASAFMTADIVGADPSLGRIKNIEQTWLGAIQIYLKKRADLPDFGGTLSPWALAVLNPHPNMWSGDFPQDYGDGTVAAHLSIDVANWDALGIVHGKPARECTPEEFVDEIRAQLRVDFGDPGLLPDEDIHSVSHNPALSYGPDGRMINDEPLFATTPGVWENQPEAVTAIPNLFLAASYVRTVRGNDSTDCANEAGKRAANGVLAISGDTSEPAPLAEFSGGSLAAAWAEDDRRYDAGLPNAYDFLSFDARK